jgi:hypothetical protein
MNDDAIVRSMRKTSDEELLAITSGAEMGYTDQARAIAEMVLRERRVQLPPDLRGSRKRGAIAEAEARRRVDELNAANDKALGRSWGFRLLIIGVGGFVLPFFGWQFVVLIPFGWAIPVAAAIIGIAGYILLVRTEGDASETPPQDER